MRSFLTIGVIILALVGIITAVAYHFNTQKTPLPILQPKDINPELVDADVMSMTKHRIGSFSLIDQHNQVTTDQDLEGKIYVADFFFTTCKTICPIMSGQMGRVAEAYKGQDLVQLRSFSVIPEEDSPEVLNEYAKLYDIDYEQWKLITGEKKEIYSLARKSYFTLKKTEVGQGDGGQSDFIHTNNFVLVDWKKRIRGYYDGTSSTEVDQLIEDIKNLIEEKKRFNQ